MKYIYRGRAATAARGASASSVRRVFFPIFAMFFCLLVPNTHNKGCMDILRASLHTVLISFILCPPPLFPPPLMSCCFALFFARNILIVARELGTHQTFFLGQLSVLGKGQYLGHRDCDSLGARFEPLVSSRKIREKIKKTTKKMLLPVGRRSSNMGAHTTHKSENKGRARGWPRGPPPTTTPFFFLLSTKRGVREKKK